MQFTMPIAGKWDPEQIIRNFKALRGEIKWKNFELNYAPDTFEKKGYFVFGLRTGIGKEKCACIAFGSQPSDPNWNPQADVAEPFDLIDIHDLVAVALHFSEEKALDSCTRSSMSPMEMPT